MLRSLVSRGTRRRAPCDAFSGAKAFATEAPSKNEQSLNELWMRALEPKPPAKVRLPDAELAKNAKLASTYVKLMWKRERILKKDLNRKILLKWAAIYALPTDELRRQALVVDPFVPTFKLPRVTPPLAGFQGPDAQKAEAEERQAAAEAASTASDSAKPGAASASSAKPSGPSRGGPGGSRNKGGRPSMDLASMLGLQEVKEAPAPSKPVAGNKRQ